ncbi:hypothetical protein OB938_10100 [Aeromonas salmonicida]|nr:hypothetical protein [Aeromonas salmonicida]MDM5150187.1 hypothetical protein [Aeromonas salmonicida]
MVSVVAVSVGRDQPVKQHIAPGIVKTHLLAGPYPGGDQVIRAGGKGHIDTVIVLATQMPQPGQCRDKVLALQPDLMDALQLLVAKKGKQLSTAAHQFYLGKRMGAAHLLQERQQEQIVADPVGAADDEDPLGWLV